MFTSADELMLLGCECLKLRVLYDQKVLLSFSPGTLRKEPHPKEEIQFYSLTLLHLCINVTHFYIFS